MPEAGGAPGGGGGGGSGAGGFAGVGVDAGFFGAQLRTVTAAANRSIRCIDYSLVLVRPKMATTSVSSLDTFSSFHPRLRMSVRQTMSFSHSSAVVRNTRRSATFSQWGGYGADDGFAVTGEEVAGP